VSKRLAVALVKATGGSSGKTTGSISGKNDWRQETSDVGRCESEDLEGNKRAVAKVRAAKAKGKQ